MRTSINIKLMLMSCTVAVLVAGLFFYALHQLRQCQGIILGQYEEKLVKSHKDRVMALAVSMSQALTQATSGLKSQKEKENAIRGILAPVRFPPYETGYFFALHKDGRKPSFPTYAKLLGGDPALDPSHSKQVFKLFKEQYDRGGGFCSFQAKSPGGERVAYVIPVSTTDLMLIATVSLSDIEKDIKTASELYKEAFDDVARQTFTVVFVLSLVMVLILFFLIRQRILKPIKQVSAAALALSKGDNTIKLDYSADDEVGALVKAFSEMARTRRKAETELSISEKRFKSVAESIPSALFRCLYDAHWTMLYLSPQIETITGYPADEFINNKVRTYSSIIHPDDDPAERYNVDKAIKDRGKWAMEYRVNHADGSIHWVYEEGVARYGVNNEVLYLEGFILDETERKKSEEALLEKDSRYRQLVETANDAVFIMENGRLVECNRKALEMYGGKRRDILNKQPGDLSPVRQPGGEISVIMSQKYMDAATKGHPQRFEWLHQRIDGTTFPAEVSLSAFTVKGRQFTLSLVRDISKRKKAEEEKARLEAELKQSQKMEALGTLAGGVAHDFNNILQAIQGYVELIKSSGRLDKMEAEYLQEVDRASNRAASLVERLLAFSRKLEPVFSNLEINHVVSQTVTILEHTLPKMIRIETDLEPGCGVVKGDEGQLENLLINLGSNAADAMPDGGLLTFSTRRITPDGKNEVSGLEGASPGYAEVAVSDTGNGIAPEMVEHIFDPFFTTKEIGKGTGLGLSMAYGIVTRHGGEIKCLSETGRGTTFLIKLPLWENAADPARDPILEEEAKGGPETILVVDDEIPISDMLKAYLQHWGYKVYTAASGEQALEYLGSSRDVVDLVILDLGMPGMGGNKALEAMLEMNPRIKVIIASGYMGISLDKDPVLTKAKAVLGKPYRLNQMLFKIREVLDN